jgi:fumarate reductase subunit C
VIVPVHIITSSHHHIITSSHHHIITSSHHQPKGELMKGKEYVRPMPATWWLHKRPYSLFMLREFTAVFVAGYAVFLIVLLDRAVQGPDAFDAFVEELKSPVSIVLHLIVLAMAVYHSATWFNSMAKVLVFWRGEERVSPASVVAAGYVAWVVASAAVVGILLALARG